MENKTIVFAMAMIFIISMVSAVNPQKLGEEYDIKVICINEGYCSSESYCNINVIRPNGTLIVDGQNMTNQDSFHNYTILPTDIGEYAIGGFCIDGDDSQEIDYTIDVTANGKVYDTGDSLIRIFVAIFFMLMMLTFYKVSKSINYESWYEKIKEKYITKNMIKWSLAAIVYVIMINGYIVYFLLGLPIMLIITDLVFIYNITSIALYVQSLLYIYITLIIVLGIVFMGYLQEFFMGYIEQMKSIEWGVEHD